MKALIVDDEPNSHKVLHALLSSHHPEIELAGSGYNVSEGKKLLSKAKPDLLFLDVEMPDGTGFDLLEQTPGLDCRVIFITAHNHYAKRAIRFGAIDFLTKPITAEELNVSLNLVDQAEAHRATLAEQIRSTLEAQRQFRAHELPSRFAIRTREGILYRQVKDLVRLEASTNYTEIYFSSTPSKVLASVNLGEYEDQFSDYPYLQRTHRSHLVNLYGVNKFITQDGGYLELNDGTQVPVSRRWKDEVIERLEQL